MAMPRIFFGTRCEQCWESIPCKCSAQKERDRLQQELSEKQDTITALICHTYGPKSKMSDYQKKLVSKALKEFQPSDTPR